MLQYLTIVRYDAFDRYYRDPVTQPETPAARLAARRHDGQYDPRENHQGENRYG
jgi:hypothetical protein